MGTLTETVAGQRRSRLLYLLLAASIFTAKVVIVSAVVTLQEVTAMGLAYAVLLSILGLTPRLRAALVVVPLFVYVVLWRLEPFQFGPAARTFGWLPFYSFFYGSTDLNVESFLEKVFYY